MCRACIIAIGERGTCLSIREEACRTDSLAGSKACPRYRVYKE